MLGLLNWGLLLGLLLNRLGGNDYVCLLGLHFRCGLVLNLG